MKRLHSAILTAGLALACIATASAAPTIGSGGGYYGSADFVGPTGMVVGPYPTYAECYAAFQAALHNQVHNHGQVVQSISPCHYRPPFGYAQPYNEYYELAVSGNDGASSAENAMELLREVTRIRAAYRVDEFDQALKALILVTDPDEDEDFDRCH